MAHRQSPRDRVRTALSHVQPDRVPFAWGFGPTPEMTALLEQTLAEQGISWQRLHRVTDDVLPISPRYIGPSLAPHTDIWGIRRRSTSYGVGTYDEIAFYPLSGVCDESEIEAYPFPDPAQYDYAGFRSSILYADPDYYKAHKLNIDVCGNPLEIYCWMTGLEEALINLISNPTVVRAALRRISNFFEHKLERALENTADLIDLLYYADDLGGQNSLLISRKTYRDVVMPHHARLIACGKQLAPDAYAMLHTDGAVFDILPDLMDAGVEVLEAVQTDAFGMQPARLKQAVGDRLSFHGGISVQALLPHEDEATVYTECVRLVEQFGMHGGYIAAPTHAIQIGTPPQNVMSMLRAVLGDEDYLSALDASAL